MCLHVVDDIILYGVFLLMSGLSGRGVVVYKVGLPLMFAPGLY